MTTRILISGASVAGPAAAYWLNRYGFATTVVERASTLRGGGYAVDFRGPTHLTVLERMGILDELNGLDTGGSPMSFIDESGRESFNLPAEFAGGDLEVLRADLSAVLHEHTKHRTEYIFGDSIASLEDSGDDVRVTFENGAPRTFDLVIGADGLRSNVRRLTFGSRPDVVSFLGYYVAGWDVPNDIGVGTTALMCNVPGKLASVAADHRTPSRASTLFAFAAQQLEDHRLGTEAQKQVLRTTFADMGWHVPALLDGLDTTPELYFDSISRVDIETWSRGRVALLGDAAHGATLGGMGTGSAIVGAYILAGELADAGGDHHRAFVQYEEKFRRYATRCQDGGRRAGQFLAPSSPFRLRMRNRLMRTGFVKNMLLKASASRTDGITLDDYPARHPKPVDAS
ncbi:FAD-dependent monooxygenase [Phytoactinopolyspora mesophila]|uniref:FAD-dependent oxidoreductase n=1 Tax=Phytoactinopolyspora mesophila TaxID=2650750 RepID=A0A7K3M197_9ACTN|nr:FAD-dependent monooxygenase [Phytoactinopolyspora mesophila]NDL56817.1 FAD-dependent oxidoreductase [Phytoactinopolyspora mesophila]